ncbi:MAG TPA: protein YgfX [Burkholderiales bacterium]
MSIESPDSLTIELGPSHVLIGVFVLLHAGTGVLAVILPIALALKIPLVALIALSLVRTVAVHGLRRGGTAVTALLLSEEECLLRRRKANDWETGRLVDSWVQPWLTLLVVRSDGQRWPTSVVILPDAVAPDTFRRLRVRLRLKTAAARV